MMRTVSDPVHPDAATAEKLLDPLSLSDVQRDYPDIMDTLLTIYILKNRDEYRNKFIDKDKGANLFSLMTETVEPSVETRNVIFAIDDYIEEKEKGEFIYSANSEIPKDFDFTKIIPRSQKSRIDQKRRVKEKAEVFTPTWVCNIQNNLIDDESVYPSAFNVTSDDQKTWTPTDAYVFSDSVQAVEYIHKNRLEITAGEAPYLVSTYDTVTGQYLPVRDEQNRFQRIGLLDRKMRVVTEFAGTSENDGDIEMWKSLAHGAFCSTYGYEWQGDNLLLARLNLLNTYRDYYWDAWKEEPSIEDMHQISVIISMNLWQMDGLRAVLPLSAGEDKGMVSKDIKPNKKTGFYDGVIPIVSFDHKKTQDSPKWVPFEEVMRDWLKSKV